MRTFFFFLGFIHWAFLTLRFFPPFEDPLLLSSVLRVWLWIFPGLHPFLFWDIPVSPQDKQFLIEFASPMENLPRVAGPTFFFFYLDITPDFFSFLFLLVSGEITRRSFYKDPVGSHLLLSPFSCKRANFAREKGVLRVLTFFLKTHVEGSHRWCLPPNLGVFLILPPPLNPEFVSPEVGPEEKTSQRPFFQFLFSIHFFHPASLVCVRLPSKKGKRCLRLNFYLSTGDPLMGLSLPFSPKGSFLILWFFMCSILKATMSLPRLCQTRTRHRLPKMFILGPSDPTFPITRKATSSNLQI